MQAGGRDGRRGSIRFHLLPPSMFSVWAVFLFRGVRIRLGKASLLQRVTCHLCGRGSLRFVELSVLAHNAP